MLNTTVLASLQATESATGLALAASVADIVVAGAVLVLAVLGALTFWRLNALWPMRGAP